MKELKFSAGLWVYGQVPDRYLPNGYHELKSLRERMAEIKQTYAIEGIELPYGPILRKENCDEIMALINEVKLKVTSLTVNVVGDRKWAKGSLTNPDETIRQEAKELIIDSMNTAKKIGVSVVNLWMGQEGFDYVFESDYSVLWKRLSQGISQCARTCEDVKLSIEYKKMEPRARNIPNSTAQALLLAIEGKNDNVGVTVDIGHAIMGGENASQSAMLLNDYHKLFNIHINDNYADWDWDMIAGCDHWWQLVEFCYYLKRIDFDLPLCVDIFPYRQNSQKATELSIKAMKKAWSIANALSEDFVRECMKKQQPLDVFEKLLSL